MDHLRVHVQPFNPQALRTHLERHGARVGKQSQHHGAEGFSPLPYLFDPEANMIELKGPPEV